MQGLKGGLKNSPWAVDRGKHEEAQGAGDEELGQAIHDLEGGLFMLIGLQCMTEGLQSVGVLGFRSSEFDGVRIWGCLACDLGRQRHDGHSWHRP